MSVVLGGRDTIASQAYHDSYVRYAFGRSDRTAGSKLSKVRAAVTDNLNLELGIKNVFDKMPPFDPFNAPFFYSPYGDFLLRTYWLGVKKEF